MPREIRPESISMNILDAPFDGRVVEGKGKAPINTQKVLPKLETNLKKLGKRIVAAGRRRLRVIIHQHSLGGADPRTRHAFDQGARAIGDDAIIEILQERGLCV